MFLQNDANKKSGPLKFRNLCGENLSNSTYKNTLPIILRIPVNGEREKESLYDVRLIKNVWPSINFPF